MATFSVPYVGIGPSVSSTGASATVPLPADLQAGDLILLVCASPYAESFPPSANNGFSVPGYTDQQNFWASAPYAQGAVFTRVCGPCEHAPTVTTSVFNQESRGWSARAVAYRNVSEVWASSQGLVAAAATATAGAWVTDGEGVLVVFAVTTDDNGLALDVPQGFTLRGSADITAGADHSVAIADKAVGVETVTTPTWRETANGNDPWVFVTLELHGITINPAGTYTFDPPVVAAVPVIDIARPHDRANRLMRHYCAQPAGRSVLKVGGVYQTVDSPEASLVASATEAYIGGYRYQVSATVATALAAAGYTVQG